MTEIKEYWNEIIRLNNLGVRYLEEGILHQAQICFREASEYCEEVSYDSSPVDECGLHPNHWVSLSQAFPSIPAYSESCETVLKPLHPVALSIGQQEIPKDAFIPDVGRRGAVLTSRLDWIIDFNLATTVQLCAFLHDGGNAQSPSATSKKYFQEAYEIFDELSWDIAEWTNYSASVDICIFLMMLFQNQRIICKYLGNATLPSRFLLRILHIQQSIGGSTTMLPSGGSSCPIGGLSSSGKNHCAPTA